MLQAKRQAETAAATATAEAQQQAAQAQQAKQQAEKLHLRTEQVQYACLSSNDSHAVWLPEWIFLN